MPTPNAGPPWDLPIDEAPLAFVDLEMTGLDASIDHVVEICIERWRGNVCEGTLESLVKPPARAGGNAHVHGIDEAALATAPPFESLIGEIERLLDGAIFVAHAAEYDAKFLVAEMKRAGRDIVLEHWIDTLVLSRRAFVLSSYSLSSLAAHLGVPHVRAHRAGDDVRAMRAVFARCIETLAPVSARDLWEVRIAERRARVAIIAACEVAVTSAAPVEVVYRPAHRKAHSLNMIITEVRAGLDPPRVLGYLLPGRGRRELRADRILRIGPASVSESG